MFVFLFDSLSTFSCMCPPLVVRLSYIFLSGICLFVIFCHIFALMFAHVLTLFPHLFICLCKFFQVSIWFSVYRLFLGLLSQSLLVYLYERAFMVRLLEVNQ
jgi:hypothetical protein